MSHNQTRWTKSDVEYLVDNYRIHSVAEIASYLGRGEQAIRIKAYQLGITQNVSQNHGNWTQSEIDLLIELYPISPWSELREQFNRGEMSIRAMSRKLGLVRKNTNHPYTDDEIKFITDNMDSMTVSQIAAHLDRPVGNVGSKIRRIRNPPQKTDLSGCARRPWSDDDIAYLEEHYPTTHTRILAKELDRSPQAIITKAQKLGIKAIKHYHRPDSHADPINSPYVYLSEPDKAYIAGVLDGEGHIEFRDRRDGGGKAIYLDVGNTCYDLIEYLKNKCGGTVYKHKSQPNRRTLWTWRVSSINTRHLLIAVYPYLIVKKEEAKAVIQYEHSYSPP